MSPEYFHTKLTFREAKRYIRGVGRRYRPHWEMARLVADIVARVAGNKEGVKLDFPWEKKIQEVTKEERLNLQMAAEHAKTLFE